MKLKIDQPVLEFDGITPIKDGNADLTYRSVIENAIALQSQAESLTVAQKITAFRIGIRLNRKKLDEYDLTIDDIKFVKDRIGIFYTPVIYGRFLELIGDESVKED